MRAVIMVKDDPHYRKDAIVFGLQSCGFVICASIKDIKPCDVLVLWNRTYQFEHEACRFESVGASVIVVENGYLGREWRGTTWYALSIGSHNGAGKTVCSSGARWRKYGFELQEMRNGGSEIVHLMQRGIGQRGVAMPRDWTDVVSKFCKVRTRNHPGQRQCVALEDDLANASAVITWGSGAAIKAMVIGVPVIYGMPEWIAEEGGVHITEQGGTINRISAMESVMDGMWTIAEIESGEAFCRLLACA